MPSAKKYVAIMIYTDLLETCHFGFFLTTVYSFLAILSIFHCSILIAATMQSLVAVAMACDWQIIRLRGDHEDSTVRRSLIYS